MFSVICQKLLKIVVDFSVPFQLALSDICLYIHFDLNSRSLPSSHAFFPFIESPLIEFQFFRRTSSIRIINAKTFAAFSEVVR